MVDENNAHAQTPSIYQKLATLAAYLLPYSPLCLGVGLVGIGAFFGLIFAENTHNHYHLSSLCLTTWSFLLYAIIHLFGPRETTRKPSWIKQKIKPIIEVLKLFIIAPALIACLYLSAKTLGAWLAVF